MPIPPSLTLFFFNIVFSDKFKLIGMFFLRVRDKFSYPLKIAQAYSSF